MQLIDEKEALAVPSYAFPRRHRCEGLECARLERERALGTGRCAEPIETGPHLFVPRGSDHVPRIGTAVLLARRGGRPSTRWTTLRLRHEHAPPGSRNVVLAVDGPRAVIRSASSSGVPAGTYDACASWRRRSGEAFSFPPVTAGLTAGRAHVFAASGATGAVYARMLAFGHDGRPTGIREELALIDYRVFDDDERKPDRLRWTLTRVVAQSADPGRLPKLPLRPALAEDLVLLAESARNGFEEYGLGMRPRPIPEP